MTGKEKLNWIIDIGASHHMTGNLEYLTDLRNIMTCPIGLLNGKQAKALKERTVFLNEHIKLKNVLYVPWFNCNLISVS